MSTGHIDDVFTREEPLGPIAITDKISPEVLRELYDEDAEPHRASRRHPPTFIVGRRGSGKTSLLLSRELDRDSVNVHLRSDGTFSRVNAAVRRLEEKLVLTEEGVADVWELLLWGPIAMRLVSTQRPTDPDGEYYALWEELAPVRNAVAENRVDPPDDIAVDYMAAKLVGLIEQNRQLYGADMLGRHLHLYARPWNECIDMARHLIAARHAKVYVLIDSLENAGPKLGDLALTLRGLFHLVGRIGFRASRDTYQLQCCFPSELWPLLHQISANPLKDFSRAMVLQWQGSDLVHAANARLRQFLRVVYPQLDIAEPTLATVLPPRILNRMGLEEPTVSYMFRHTQLLPRQFLYIVNRAIARAIAETDLPFVKPKHLVDAVAEVETILCPEIFAAYGYQYPQAHDVAHRLIPFLPFRFNDSFLHQMCNQASIQKSFDLEYHEVREMLARLGILGRFRGEKSYYVTADFEYAVEGTLNLAPDDEYCLHPLFVRECKSRDIRLLNVHAKPVYPLGTPVRNWFAE